MFFAGDPLIPLDGARPPRLSPARPAAVPDPCQTNRYPVARAARRATAVPVARRASQDARCWRSQSAAVGAGGSRAGRDDPVGRADPPVWSSERRSGKAEDLLGGSARRPGSRPRRASGAGRPSEVRWLPKLRAAPPAREQRRGAVRSARSRSQQERYRPPANGERCCWSA